MRNAQNVLINEKCTLKEAVKLIDKGKLGIAIVADKKCRLRGIVTDVDVRKAILKGYSLDSLIKDTMNKNPLIAENGSTKGEVLTMMRKNNLRQIPIIDEKKRIVGVELLNDYFESKKYSNTVVIMAGGVGKRLRILTKKLPKPMLPLGKKPVLEHIISAFKFYGFEKFIISVNYKKEKIKSFFKNGEHLGVDISYISENMPLGTAGPLSLVSETGIQDDFFVVNSDLLTSVNLSHMMDYHKSHKDTVTIGIKDYMVDIPYGVVKMKNGKLEKFDEKPRIKSYINAGIYIMNPKVLKNIKKNEKLDMISFIERLQANKLKVACFPIHEYWLDIGHMENYEKANKDYRKVLKNEIKR